MNHLKLSEVKILEKFLKEDKIKVLLEENTKEYNESLSNLFKLTCVLYSIVKRKIEQIAENMNAIEEEVTKNPIADGFGFDFYQSIPESIYDDEKLYFVVETNWHGENIESLIIPESYLTDENWKIRYKDEVVKKQKRKEEHLKSEEYKRELELQLLAELKAKYEK